MMAEMQKQQQKAQQKQPGGAPKPSAPGKVYLVVNTRRNSILVHAPPDQMAIIEEAIGAIDVPSDRVHSLLRNKDRMQVYRLENLDPQPLIKTLEDLGDLDFDTRLEVDTQNNAIIAYASLADHLTIHSLIDKLDGGGRHAEVVPLTELRAATVAQTIDFMMGGGREEENKQDDSRSRRSYFPFFGGFDGGSSRSGRSEQHTERFRVDADVKHNRLLLWCNEFELAKVQQLLGHLRKMPEGDRQPNTPKVYRLVTLDPEPFVKALKDMETLDFYTRLEVDQQNGAILAYASQADHAKIADLIATLDGSGRQFHVISLRRLEADNVAGTISFMMAGKDDSQSSGYSRTYVYNEYYGGGPSRGGKQKKPDEFRVDADVEYNRLLLWANDIEIEEVKNLLVKLGEIPSEGGDTSTIRVLDVMPGPDQQRLIEQIRRIWPSLAPNPLLTPPPEESQEKKEKNEQKQPEEKTDSVPSGPNTARGGTPQSHPPVAKAAPQRSVFRLAQLKQEDPPPEASAEVQPELPPPPDKQPQEPLQPPAQPEQPPSRDAPADPAGKPAPVSITQGPDGRLIISSQDTKALNQLEELMVRLTPPRKEFEVFQLRYAEAFWISLNLEDFFKEKEESGNNMRSYMYGYYGYSPQSNSAASTRRLSKRRPLKFISDDDTNTIVVLGADPAQLRTIEELIQLYDQPHMADSESARKTEIFQIRYSQATVIAEAVKEVYRDLLSTRDKALAKQQSDRQQRPESRYSFYSSGTGDDTLEKRPKFKGMLSMGVDQLSNTLIVSAPESLFGDVSKMILALDEAAKPVANIRVVKLGAGVSAEGVRDALSEILGDGSSGRKPGPRPPTPKPPQNGPRPPNGPRPGNN